MDGHSGKHSITMLVFGKARAGDDDDDDDDFQYINDGIAGQG
jgi:hypothetical protein